MFVSFVFQLLLMENPESPPWPSLGFSSQSQRGILGEFKDLLIDLVYTFPDLVDRNEFRTLKSDILYDK